ncbi:glycoside hydrolase family 15 protein [Candidatus Parvarchaeota archaeon]|nr:glycoside hydrolase family 15 protein [Candidatus Parvarchaeota archaeon]
MVKKGFKKWYFYAVLLIITVVLLTIFLAQKSKNLIDYNVSTYNSSVSSLLLSNWVNNSIFVYTGINNSEVGLYGQPFISDIMIGKYGLLTDKLYFLDGNTKNVTLKLNNEIMLNRNDSTDLISTPFGSNSIIIEQNSTGLDSFLFQLKGKNEYSLDNSTVTVGNNPKIYIYSPNSAFNASVNANYTNITINNKGDMYIIISFSQFNETNVSKVLIANGVYIKKWLYSSNNISLGGSFLTQYYTSLLLLKDDQNPLTGEFSASPSPIYLYAWVRDGSFAAMSLQDAGHINSAEKYWVWMKSVQKSDGTWYTRYNFWTSAPDTSYGIPEYDSVGLFQIGVSSLYNITHNLTLIMQFLPVINRSLQWEELNINKSKILPQDLSIWEDVMAYNFWTQAMDLIGMKDSVALLNSLKENSSKINYYSNILNNTIENDFYNGSFYGEYVTPSELYVNGTGQLVFTPTMIADSSSILPIAFGLISLNSTQAKNDITAMINSLDIEGGLARFTGDTYHYTLSLRDSSGPMPPWIITTLFLAYYDEKDGNYSGAFNLMKWSIQHSQDFLLPEAIDPNHGNPLQTTSPLTWSSAMYIIAALNYK